MSVFPYRSATKLPAMRSRHTRRAPVAKVRPVRPVAEAWKAPLVVVSAIVFHTIDAHAPDQFPDHTPASDGVYLGVAEKRSGRALRRRGRARCAPSAAVAE